VLVWQANLHAYTWYSKHKKYKYSITSI